ncbi:hypothetical protein KO494_00005 [Lacinutrix sp. C3R15]|uniref:hypothetical protein n=1 Tax=Flavobacteriaceae TaxID=49546 RepID=UPI001C083285|nr:MULTISPECIES: hypothetical protein [Flavobacteriaceae]MBU2937908.1 hypothetical protein [Lacinutrix sp. C3R15]MDO6621222.1 hypothetical protein [Oceanihabitans sp. 1_MG-2023]
MGAVQIIIIITIIVLIFGNWVRQGYLRKEKEDANRKITKEQNRIKLLKEKENTDSKIEKAHLLNEQIEAIKKINILSVDDYKKTIINNETSIIEKGGENQLFLFLKIDSFLKGYRGRIVADCEEWGNLIDIDVIIKRIVEDSKRNDFEKMHENLQAGLAELEGKKPIGFDANLERMFKIGRFVKPAIENQIKTLEFYKNMAVSMIVFYQNDRKIRYFEIYEAFEKLGVFDSTWQKNVLNKLDKIEVRLSKISNQLTDLNQNFVSLIESSEKIASELKEVNSNIMTNNMLQSITAYQTWKVNRNTKSLRN